MDHFESAIAVSLNAAWKEIKGKINQSAQLLSGRAGSSVAEDVILDALESLTPENLEELKEQVNATLVCSENPYRFSGFRFRSKEGNKEATSRSIEDIIVVIQKDEEMIDSYINIKVSNGKKGQADNSCSWKAASYALYGKLDITRRDKFLKIIDDFSTQEHHNYFFWVLFKNENATSLENGHINSLLSIRPGAGLRFNINQPFPVQVIHFTDAKAETDDYPEISLYQRRSLLHSWLTINMSEKYSNMSSNVIHSLSEHPSIDNLASYRQLRQAQEKQIKELVDLENETARLAVVEHLKKRERRYDEVVIEDGQIIARLDGETILQLKPEEIPGKLI